MRKLLIATVAALLAASANAAESDSHDQQPKHRDSAVAACLDFNQYKPAELVDAAEDGMGDWIVWVRDKDQDLWLCNADKDGDVYANVLLNGDMLDGEGSQLIDDDGTHRHPGPAESAERLCAAVGSTKEELEIVATVDDALGDYVVWLKNKSDAYWMCNASSDNKLYTFEQVEYPLDKQPATSEDTTCCETSSNRQT